MAGKRFSLQSDFTLAQKGVLLVSVPLLFELFFVGTLAFLLHQAEAEVRRETHAREVTDAVNKVIQDMFETKHFIHGGLFKRDDNAALAQVQVYRSEIDKIEELVRDNPRQVETVQKTRKELERAIQLLWKVREIIFGEGGFDKHNPSVRQVNHEFDRIKNDAEQDLGALMAEQERVVQQSPKIQAQFRRQVEALLIAGIAINVLLAVALALHFSKGTARRLEVLMDNTKRLAEGKELNPPLGGTDEIGRLDRVFADMAAALEAAARKERAIVENATDMICSLDADGKFTAVNPACLKVLGYAQEDLLGTELNDLVIEEDREQTTRAMAKLKTGDVSMSFENRVKTKDGAIVDMLWSSHWAPDENTMFCVAHDMSARKQLERMKQDFMAMVSHDLRTPLTTVQVIHSNLQKKHYGEIPERAEKAVNTAENNIDRLLKLVNDLLQTARAEAGKLELHFEDTKVSSIVEKSVMSVLSFADENGVNIEVEMDDSPIRADEDRLVQVLVNLLSNAVKFSPRGSSIEISTNDGGDTVELRVSDQGRGIPADLRDAIFDPFRQVRATDATKKGGTGLGLSICKSIVEEHGGTIGVESEIDKGSTFWFRIPKMSAPQASVEREG